VDVYETLVEIGRELFRGDEALAAAFAQGRAGSVSEARESWSTAAPAVSIPSGLWPEVEKSVAAEAAAFNVSAQTARRRVTFLVQEKLSSDGPWAARQALVAHRGRLGVR
jgi:hypothetical protein